LSIISQSAHLTASIKAIIVGEKNFAAAGYGSGKVEGVRGFETVGRSQPGCSVDHQMEHYVIFNITDRKILLPPKAAEKHRVSPNFLLLFFLGESRRLR